MWIKKLCLVLFFIGSITWSILTAAKKHPMETTNKKVHSRILKHVFSFLKIIFNSFCPSKEQKNNSQLLNSLTQSLRTTVRWRKVFRSLFWHSQGKGLCHTNKPVKILHLLCTFVNPHQRIFREWKEGKEGGKKGRGEGRGSGRETRILAPPCPLNQEPATQVDGPDQESNLGRCRVRVKL